MTSKTLHKKDYINWLSIAFDENVAQVLIDRNKVGIETATQYTALYQFLSHQKSPEMIYDVFNYGHSDLSCILKFFDEKHYQVLEFPQDHEFLFHLEKIAQQGYKPLKKIKSFIKLSIELLGEEVFLETVLRHMKHIDSKDNIFSRMNIDYVHDHFILKSFELVFDNYKKTDPQKLKINVEKLFSGRNIPSSILYKKFKTIDAYIGDSTFAKQLYEYNSKNEKFVELVKNIDIKELKNNLEKDLGRNPNKKTDINQKKIKI